ncbi:hypothetical protein EDEG_00275 [Edhazardia aedis USNM 41457]|uniref:Major facilitator superfamily associated domain-containing protein n=1 Tax=Edhazardia aedis (strain USNM 41457) TaxID=1003232 RepID=J9DM64_EDHAE|nr:hypothetical protein EDEG_00275 [Edhazardia aedis USNM 41457]|eukprot:EJW02472.1 hypothetical protein EDEG_00275 [Edhazardia aedis USNM 41457]
MISSIRKFNNKFLVSPKLLYFFVNLQFYTLHQFRGNFAKDFFGISKQEYGYFLGILLFATFFTNILIATLNDKFQRQRICLIGLIVVSSVFFQLFYVDSFISMFTGMFWVNMLLYLMFNTSIPPLLDKITIDKLSNLPTVGAKTYGRQRMWGTIGYLTANFLVERSLKIGTSSDISMNYDNLKYYQALTTAIAAVLVFFLVKSSRNARPRNDMMRSWSALLLNKDYMFFIFIILLNGISRAGMTMYLSIYLKDIMEVEGYDLDNWPSFLVSFLNVFNKSPLSTISFAGVILEIIILFNAERITSFFGLYYPLLFAQAFQCFRFVCYYFAKSGTSHLFPIICIIELMKGLNFGLTHICAVQIANKLCPHHLKTTSQMIYSGTFTGLAGIFAGFMFGSIFSAEKMSSEDMSTSEKAKTFSNFFLLNIAFTILSIGLFVARYGQLGTRNLHWPFWRSAPSDKKSENENNNNNQEEEDSDHESDSSYMDDDDDLGSPVEHSVHVNDLENSTKPAKPTNTV